MDSVVRNVVEPFFDIIFKRLTELENKIIIIDAKMTKMEHNILVLGYKIDTLNVDVPNCTICKMEEVD